jgi:LPXTG-motif cell wall-anchored protein
MTESLWTLAIGFSVGLIAKFFMPGENKPQGFVLTTLLGIAGAFVGTFLGQFVGYLKPGEQGNFIVSIIGAIVVLALWGWIAQRKQS